VDAAVDIVHVALNHWRSVLIATGAGQVEPISDERPNVNAVDRVVNPLDEESWMVATRVRPVELQVRWKNPTSLCAAVSGPRLYPVLTYDVDRAFVRKSLSAATLTIAITPPPGFPPRR